MNPHTWALFLGAVFLLSGTPGPNMLHVMTRSLRFGLVGIQAWRGAGGATEIGTVPVPPSRFGLLRGGFLIGVSHPKLLLFSVAFLPHFVDPGRDRSLQFAILVVIFAAAEAFWYTVYALGGRRLARWQSRPALRRLFDRATAAIFVGFGLGLLVARP